MKQYFTLLLLGICFISYSQQYSSSNPQFQWGAWTQMPCYKGIYVRVQKAYFNKSANNWYWNWEFQNRYSKKMSVSFRFFDSKKSDDFYDGRTTGRATLQSNEIRKNGAFGREDKIDFKFENLCFEFSNYNGTILDNCSSEPEIYKKGFYYADCDNGTPNYKKYTGSSSANNPSNNSGGNHNAQSNGNAQARIDELNGYLLQISDDDQEKKNILMGVERIKNSTSYSDQQMADQIKPFIERAKKRANQLGKESDNTHKANSSRLAAEQKQANDEAERQATQQKQAQKAYEDKANRINNYLQKGESALSAGNYDEAMSNFAQASNICSDDPQFQQQRLEAQNALARAQKAKEDAARKVRIENRQKQEAATNTAVAGAATATVGLMALLNDDYTEKPFAARAQIGLGVDKMTMTTVESKKGEEIVQSPITANFLLGLNLSFFNNKGIQLHLNPYLDYGVVALQEGYQGSSLKYGGNAMLQLGLKNENLFKLFVEGGYAQRSGYMDYDRDVANGGITATDYLTKGSFEYSVIRYGGGVMLHGEADKGEVRIKPGIFFEEFSFAKGQRVMSFNLHANIMSVIVVEFTYSKNYIIPGGVINPSAFKAEDRDFWGIKIIRQGLLTGK